MIQYDSEEEYVDYPSEVESKRKRLSDQYNQHGLDSEGIVEVTAWAFVGGIGLVLAIGSVLVALISPADDSAVMIIPLVYMVAVMIFMRRRR